MQRPSLAQTPSALFFAFAVLLSGCRKGTEQSSFVPVPVSAFGTDGCNGANQVFGAIVEVHDDPAVIGAMSRIAAFSLAGVISDVVYVTGADGTVRAWDFTVDPMVPVESTVVAVGEVDALLAGTLNMPPAAILSGIAVLDRSNLVVVEHVSNTILIVSLVNPNPVGFYVGFPDVTPGYVDNVAGASRFSFPDAVPVDVVTSADDRLFIADAGNHAVREATLGQLTRVATVGGSGVPGFGDGSLTSSVFDTPTGLTVSCNGEIVVAESGPLGNHLRSIALGPVSFFGGRSGMVRTLAGDGTDASTDGVGVTASLAQPVSPVSTADGEIYWVDSSTGILRRYAIDTDVVDCPLFADCDAANLAGGSFSGAGSYSLAITMSGNLYVLDGAAGKLYLVTP